MKSCGKKRINYKLITHELHRNVHWTSRLQKVYILIMCMSVQYINFRFSFRNTIGKGGGPMQCYLLFCRTRHKEHVSRNSNEVWSIFRLSSKIEVLKVKQTESLNSLDNKCKKAQMLKFWKLLSLLKIEALQKKTERNNKTKRHESKSPNYHTRPAFLDIFLQHLFPIFSSQSSNSLTLILTLQLADLVRASLPSNC